MMSYKVGPKFFYSITFNIISRFLAIEPAMKLSIMPERVFEVKSWKSASPPTTASPSNVTIYFYN